MNIGYGETNVPCNLNIHLHKKTNIKHRSNFFETGHGKGEHDGVGACVK